MGPGAPSSVDSSLTMRTTSSPWVRGLCLGAALSGLPCLIEEAQAQGADQPSLMLVIDHSGSMWGAFDATRQGKSVVVREAVRAALGKLPPRTRVGLTAFGHRRPGDCADVEIIRPPETLDAERILAPLTQITPRGRGPVGLALREAAKSFPEDNSARRLLLVHDDADNCQVDVCEVAGELSAAGIVVDVIGVGTKADDTAKMACLPQKTGGRQFTAQTAAQVVSTMEEAVKLVGFDTGSRRPAPQRPRISSAIVPPAPIPASGPPALHLKALLAPNTAPLDGPLRWLVAPEDKPGMPLFSGQSSDPVVPVTPGRYTVEVSDGLVSAQQTIAAGERPMPVTMILDAGRIDVRVRMQNNDMPIDDALVTVVRVGSDGKKGQAAGPVAVFKGSDASLLLPSGRFAVRADVGLVRSEKVVTVTAGQAAAVDFPLSVARIALSAAGPGRNEPLGEPVFSILEDDPDAPSGRREIARSAMPQAEFTLPPGTYYAAATIGGLEVRDRFSAGPGSVVRRALSIPIGRLNLSTKVPAGPLGGQAVSYAIRSLDVAGQDPTVTSALSPVLALRAGRYRVEARYGSTNIAAVREVEVRDGQTQDIAFEHAAARLKLRLLVAAGQPRDIFWSVFDSGEQPVWSSAQTESAVLLRPGPYRIVAETRERRQEHRIDLRAGEDRALDVEGP